MRRVEARYLVILCLISILELSLGFGRVTDDSPMYTSVSLFLAGRAQEYHPIGIYRPLVAFLSSLLLPFVELNVAFGIVNSCLWLLTTLLLFFFSRDLLLDDELAFYSSLMFTSAPTLIIFGSAVMVDMECYFFLLLSAFLIRYADQSRRVRDLLATPLVMGLAILTKELLYCVVLMFLLMELSGSRSWRRVVVVVALTSLLVALWYLPLHLNPLSRWLESHHPSLVTGTRLSRFLGLGRLSASVLRSMGMAAPLALLGFIVEPDNENLRFYYAFFASIFFTLALCPIHERFTFMLFPCVFTLASRGLRWFSKKLTEKPVFSAIPSRGYELLIMAIYFIASNHQAYAALHPS